MTRPSIDNPELASILEGVERGSLNSQDAMAKLLPFLVSCEKVSELEALEPLKEYILAHR